VGSAFAACCLIWGSTWLAIRIGLEGVPPFTAVALRFALASAIVLGIAVARGVPLGRSARERWLWLANGTLSFAGSYGIVYWAEQWVPSGLTAVLFATYPLFVALLAHVLVPGERVSLAELAGILTGFAGVGVIFSEDLRALVGHGVPLAAGLMLVSPLVSAVSSVAIKRWGAGIHPLSLTAVPMAIGASLTGVVALWTEREAAVAWTGASIAALLYLTVFGSVVTFTLYYWLLERMAVKRLALIAYVIPVEAVFLGTLIDEPFSSRMLVGSMLVVGGVALAVHRPR
jgi:drug/metabolite transporter (DMT)-like permease